MKRKSKSFSLRIGTACAVASMGMALAASTAHAYSGGLCPATPLSGGGGCFPAGKSTLAFKIGTLPDYNKMTWVWSGFSKLGASAFGDPTAGTAYIFCLYDGSNLVSEAYVPAGPPLWVKKESTKGSTLKYSDSTQSQDGVSKVTLSSKTSGTEKLQVKAGGPGVAMPAFPLSGSPVTLQAWNSDNVCWSAKYPTEVQKPSAKTFKAKAPKLTFATCPASAVWGSNCGTCGDGYCLQNVATVPDNCSAGDCICTSLSSACYETGCTSDAECAAGYQCIAGLGPSVCCPPCL